ADGSAHGGVDGVGNAEEVDQGGEGVPGEDAERADGDVGGAGGGGLGEGVVHAQPGGGGEADRLDQFKRVRQVVEGKGVGEARPDVQQMGARGEDFGEGLGFGNV